jgi:integrase
MGCVYKPNPRCKLWYLKYKGTDGKTYVESSGLDNKEKAKKELRKKLAKIDEGVPITPAVGRMTFEDASKDISLDYNTKGRKSIKVMERRVRKHLLPFFGKNRRMTTIDSGLVKAYVAKRQADVIQTRKAHWETDADGNQVFIEAQHKPVSNAEINRELTTLRRMFSLAIKNERLMHQPYIGLLAESQPRQGFFESDEIDELARHLPDEIAAVARYMFITGWRVGEVLKLEWSRVDFHGRGYVRLASGTTKSGAPRVFPMTIALRALLERRDRLKKAAERETNTVIPWVFFRVVSKGRGGPKVVKPIISFTKAWKSACEKAGLRGRIPHDNRRSAIRVFVRQGISENTAMALSGHKTSSVFKRYDIISPRDLDAAADKLDIPLAPATGKRPAKVRKFARR